MKKILVIMLTIAMAVSFAACGGKTEADTQANPDIQQTTPENNETVLQSEETPSETEAETIEGDPVEYGREYWEEKYPGENICPFSIDENGTEKSYYWISSFDGWDGTISSWLAQPFNWNGWHKTEDGAIVNEDETLKITDNWANGEESLSSFCVITTEKYEKAE